MKRLVKWLLVAVLLLAVAFFAGAYVLPGEISAQRSIDIAAPPDRIFAVVGDLRRGKEFSPWAEIDPNTQYDFDKSEPGIGQTMRWHSTHQEVGTGSMIVTEYEPDHHMASALDLGDMGRATTSFDLVPVSGGGTIVTWGFKAALSNPLERWMCVFLDFDSLIGKDYEKGLAKLKTLLESQQPDSP
jgi:uncharacterized protein YndB with AHSA1/START domain